VKLLSFEAETADESNLQDSDVIVSGGRGMKKGDNFQLLHDLASLLGGMVGASRDAVDRGWARYPQQVGLSGKTVLAKALYRFGHLRRHQHLAGMKTAETIVAVNTDPNAAIFHVADFGIVGDAFQVLPELISRLEERKS
jgi:electron transfer flavoprotein alpha subunit